MLVWVSLLVRNQGFVLRGAPARKHELRRPASVQPQNTALSMASGDADKSKDDIKPTSEDPSLSVKAAW